MKLLLNAVLYQSIWFIAILGGTRYLWCGVLLLGVHFVFSSKRKADALLMLCILMMGLVIDGLLKYSGFFSFNNDQFPLPLWLMMIWVAFATLPHHSLNWLKGRPLLSVLLGAVGGPLAYWAGIRLGAASFGFSLPFSLLMLGIIWSFVLPVSVKLAQLTDFSSGSIGAPEAEKCAQVSTDKY